MKKLFVLAVVSITSASAFASKARMAALQRAMHLTDTTEIVGYADGNPRPDLALNFGEFARFEWGTNQGVAGTSSTLTTAQTPYSEGGFVRKMGNDSAMGFYVGKKSYVYAQYLNIAGAATTSTTFLNQVNPWSIQYASKMGDLGWGVGFNYGNSDRKSTKQKENLMSLNLSASSAAGWDAELNLGLAGESKNETVGSERNLKVGSAMSLSGGYKMGDNYFFGSYGTANGKVTSGSGGTTTLSDTDMTSMAIGWEETKMKDGNDFYYGVSYKVTSQNDKNNTTTGKNDVTTVPFILGIEAEATSWMVLRGSVTQNVLLGSQKLSSATDADTIGGNTSVAAGAGLKWGKFLLDGTFSTVAATATNLGTDGASFLTNVGMTYSW